MDVPEGNGKRQHHRRKGEPSAPSSLGPNPMHQANRVTRTGVSLSPGGRRAMALRPKPPGDSTIDPGRGGNATDQLSAQTASVAMMDSGVDFVAVNYPAPTSSPSISWRLLPSTSKASRSAPRRLLQRLRCRGKRLGTPDPAGAVDRMPRASLSRRIVITSTF
jgi:hypothetical protein